MRKDPHIANIFSAEEEDCLTVEQMAAYQQGKLAGQDKHGVERHLLNCELCAMTFESLSENTPAEIAAGAEEVSDRAWTLVQERERRKRRGAIFWIASAASIVLLVAVGFFTLRGPTDQEMDKTFAQAMGDTPPLSTPGPIQDSGFAMAELPSKENAEGIKTVLPAEDEAGDARAKTGSVDILAPTPKPNPTPTPTPSPLSGVNSGSAMAKSNGGPGSDGGKNMLKFEPAKKTAPSLSTGKESIKGDGATQFYNAAPTASPTFATAKPNNVATGKDVRKESAEESAMELDAKNERLALDDGDADDFGGVETKTDAVTSTGVVTLSSTGESEVRSVNGIQPKVSKGKTKDIVGRTAAAQPKSIAEKNVAPAADKSYEDGLIAYRNGEYKEAARDLRRATELTPSNLDAHIFAADAYLRISQPNAALFHIERILAVPGNSHIKDAEWYKALAYLQLKEGSKAKKQLQTVIDRGGKYKPQAETALKELK